jgi:hypothetical protein
MGLVISKGLTLRKGYIGTDDPDAEAYIAAVEAADEAASPGIGALETATKVAIHSFVKGAKADGFWPAIKASCILAGARTLTGALVPLAGTAPTNFNFVSGDYNRKTGLKSVGISTDKHLNTNRAANASSFDNYHMSVFRTSTDTTGAGVFIGGSNPSFLNRIAENNARITQSSSLAAFTYSSSILTGFFGGSRDNSNSFDFRVDGATSTSNATGGSPGSVNITVFTQNISTGINTPNNTNARLAFYSIGESLDLALLDARVTDLINAFAAAIP